MATAKSTVRSAQINVGSADVPAGIVGLLDTVRSLDWRERAVLELLVSGATLRPIGRRLGVSGEAVRLIGEKAIKKIGAELRPGAAVLPGAVSRFQAILRDEQGDRLRERGQRVARRELHTVPAGA